MPDTPGLPRSTPVPVHPGLQLLSEVTAALSAGVFSESAMDRVTALLRRRLGATLCRLWVRDEDLRTYRAFAEKPDAPAPEVVAAMSEAIRGGTAETAPDAWDQLDLRVPL